MRFADPLEIYYDGLDYLGWIQEEFQAPNGAVVSARIYEVPGRRLRPHEFLRSLLPYDQELVTTDIGPVIVSTDREGTSWSAWMSKDNIALYVGGAVDPMELVRLYGAKFPSSLPADVDLNKDKWCRKEMDLTLLRLQRALDDDRVQRTDWFFFHFNRAVQHIDIPVASLEEVLTQDRAARTEVYDRIATWWSENQEQTYWDGSLRKLVTSGQSPRERHAEAVKKIDEAQEEMLATPMTDGEIRAATDALLEEFEHSKSARARSRAGFLGDHGDRVVWKQVGESEWVFQYPSQNNGPLVTETFRGPVLQETDDVQRPIMATFSRHLSNPASRWKEQTLTEQYLYDRLRRTWNPVD